MRENRNIAKESGGSIEERREKFHEEQNKEKMGALTGGMQLPPGMKMPF